MNPERLSILDRVASGELTAADAATLLNGVPKQVTDTQLADRWLHVRVTNLDTGKLKVNVNVPLTLVKAGLKIGSTYEPSIASLDWQELVSGLTATSHGKLVEVEDEEDRERVEVYVD